MEVLRPILELGVVIPGMLLAYFPVKSSLKQPLSKIVLWLAPLLALLCAAGGVVCYARRMPTAPVLAGLTLLAAVIYIKRSGSRFGNPERLHYLSVRYLPVSTAFAGRSTPLCWSVCRRRRLRHGSVCGP